MTEFEQTQQAQQPNQKPDRVGWSFIGQYYAFLNKDPGRLHCFYTKRSTLIHATEGEETTPCFGQAQINEKIMSLGFEECKVYISNVDTQPSADNGIIVQILGEVANRGGEWRRFVQTFFLAEQPNGFFVLNDILRYIKEDAPETQEEQQQIAPAATTEVEAEIQQPTQDITEDLTPTPVVQQEGTPAQETPAPPLTNGFHADVDVADADADLVAPSAAIVDPVTAELKVDLAPPPAPVSSNVAEEAKPKEEEPSPAASLVPPAAPPAQPVVETQQTAPSPSTPKAEAPAVATTSSATTPSAPAQAPAPAPTPAKPKTWASLAASAGGSGRWPAKPSEVRSVPSSGSVPRASSSTSPATTASKAPAVASQNNATTGPASNVQAGQQQQQGGEKFHPIAQSVTHAQCFVKGVQEGVNADTLRRVLESRFGPLKEYDVVRSKACAFVEFEDINAARRAIQTSLRTVEGGEGGILIESDGTGNGGDIIHIVTRKEKGDRPISTARRGGHAGSEARGAFRVGPGKGPADVPHPHTRAQQQQQHANQSQVQAQAQGQERGEDKQAGKGGFKQAKGGRGGGKTGASTNPPAGGGAK